MFFPEIRLDDREAATIVAGLHSRISDAPLLAVAAPEGGTKRAARDSGDRNNDGVDDDDAKRSRKNLAASPSSAAVAAISNNKPNKARKDPPMDATGLVFAQPELKPPPYFYYSDHSLELDDDPLMPITSVGSVPTFPAKMHAILTNPDLADVVGWAPHGRSWRILKPREFEIRVLPKYFEHSKFSSFVRQANGWGFRRMSEGYEKNAYYHEYFLRAMPWLCKKMRRPKVAEKKAVDPEMEPDLEAISRLFPVPDRPPTREVLVLQKTIELGPKARMPVLWDTASPLRTPVRRAEVEDLPPLNLSGRGCAQDGDLKPAAIVPPHLAAPIQVVAASNAFAGGNIPHMQTTVVDSTPSGYHAGVARPNNSPQVPPPQQQGGNADASHFAAGFMAATNYHSTQLRSMLESAFLAGMPVPAALSVANIAVPPAAASLGNALSQLRVEARGAGMYHQHPPPNHQHAPLSLTPRAADTRNLAAAMVVQQVLNVGGTGQQSNNLSDQAMMLRQLQQFQAYQAMGGGASQFTLPR